MKKKLLLGLTLSSSILAGGQTSKWSYGFQGSFGLGNVTNVYDSRLNNLSYGFGGQTLFRLNDHWQIGASLQYSRDSYKGNAVSDPFTLILPMFHIDHLNFTQTGINEMVRMPLQLRYNWLSPVKKIQPYTYLGVSIGYNLQIGDDRDARLTANDAYTQNFFSSVTVGYPRYSLLDYGVMAGTGLSLRTGKGTLITTEAYYYHGLKEQREIIYFFLENQYAIPYHQRQQQLRVQIGFLAEL